MASSARAVVALMILARRTPPILQGERHHLFAIGSSGAPVIDSSTDVPARPDIATLTENFGGPIQVAASCCAVPRCQRWRGQLRCLGVQSVRARLLLTNGHVIMGFSPHCDDGPWHHPMAPR